MSSILTWAVGGSQPENLDGNDTSAESEQSSQGSAWGMLRQRKGAAGCQEASRAGPTYSVSRREGANENPAGYPKGAWQFLQETQAKVKTCLHGNAWEVIAGTAEAVCRTEKVYPMLGKTGYSGNIYKK